MWYRNSIVYQIYPIGFCGAPRTNNGVQSHRILKVIDWIPHIKKLGANCILFNPVFESDAHGYDTRDYNKIDVRLGTNDDFKNVCDEIHKAGMKVVLDGVFNHAGRGFFAFKDIREKKWNSSYNDWFRISFTGDTTFHDGFWYDSWEGCCELVKFNLKNPVVKQYLFDAIKGWVRDYDIDGLRLDVAYLLDFDFLRELREMTENLKPEFALIGETLHGDYNRWLNQSACHSVTNYECYKGLHSSFNTANLHEIAYSLNRQFGPDPWCLYTGKYLLNFVDNHDVTRVATILTDKNHLKPIYTILFGMPGVPAIYYGSEWGEEGNKKDGDNALRPAFDAPRENELTSYISKLAAIRSEHIALRSGSYRQILVRPLQLIFERWYGDERILVAVNGDSNPCHLDFNAGAECGVDLITGATYNFNGGCDMGAYSCAYWLTK